MLINFRAIYEKIFSSFDISADKKLVEELEKEGVKNLIIIKRSWIFGIFLSWMFLFVLVFMIVNSFLLYFNFENKSTAYILIFLLAFNILHWIFTLVIYFSRFRKIYGIRSTIVDINVLKEELNLGDIAFAKFFNQTIFNYFILLGITVYIIYNFFFGEGYNNFMYAIASILLLFGQIFLSSKFKKRMTDLEMDFSIIIPGKIIFYNQSGILRSVQTINSEKIKTISAGFANFMGSIFNFGEIIVLTEGDEAGIGEMKLSFISHPTETVHEINALLGKEEK